MWYGVVVVVSSAVFLLYPKTVLKARAQFEPTAAASLLLSNRSIAAVGSSAAPQYRHRRLSTHKHTQSYTFCGYED